ncbi:MAG: energy transducer TonB [Verrucomicrobia bacterium]|nr:energy transducer TonB [Verrucomicrobiota bacterium]
MKIRLPLSVLALSLLFGCATESTPPPPARRAGTVELGMMKVLDPADIGPVPRMFPNTPYPPAARQEGISGSATIAFTIETDGHCTEITVKEATRPEFAAVAVETVKKARFRPAQKEGKPIRCRMEWPFVFDAK